ncbi:MAG: ABC transporter ATP-binding protein [Desulfobacula sp.]|uniref:ABC transporter ATP-binding protein n=1 Tax=Desulfobacula sp. TaxID=2593537 RepID=UPI001DF93BB4|nr:ABC transporter ATP-binding protein [Desulfobacula sp.]MBT3483829.1 ABC transporter ATP-binding protein [Desulfobacula sp.]MBT3803017.1 ABC transporter ATP-binding protein [Desulfobacula sp.]MBT4023470.1 ABC transporter ATP-binding protein [Desulfobacula sp.]MBT4197065.1 ABC transporter ATP-binding protein [Desulfobacula sp.]
MIEVQNLTKHYKDFCAVNNISMTIRKGEILGLLGPNGAGKTTTLRMLTGYFRPNSGTIKIKGFQMPEDAIRIKSLIGYLPESAPLYHNMLVYDYLEYVAKIKGIDDKEKRYDRFLQLSDICGLSSIMNKPIANLSKGLKQRVGLAHAMMTDPEILILDEPTSGLDPNQIAEIRDIIKAIGKEKTIIFSTHILSEAEATCDRIAIIHNGKMVADDTTANLKRGAQQNSMITLSLRGALKEDAASLLKSIHSTLDVKNIDPVEKDLVSFEITNLDNQSKDHDFRSDIYLKIKETDWIIVQLIKESQTLEKIFRELTREEA